MIINLYGTTASGQDWWIETDEFESFDIKPLIASNTRYTASGKTDTVNKKTKGQKMINMSLILYDLQEVKQLEETFQNTNKIKLVAEYSKGIIDDFGWCNVVGEPSLSVKVNELRVRFFYSLTLERVV